MVPGELKAVLEMMVSMKELELVLADFYKVCAERWKEDEKFWMVIQNQEIKHASNIEKMETMISQKPEIFERKIVLEDWGIKLIVSGIKTNIQKLKNNVFTKKQILYIARDIEESILEKKYGEIVVTNDREYNDIVNNIISQTTDHKNRIDRKIADLE
jgi:hypothetical protein